MKKTASHAQGEGERIFNFRAPFSSLWLRRKIAPFFVGLGEATDNGMKITDARLNDGVLCCSF